LHTYYNQGSVNLVSSTGSPIGKDPFQGKAAASQDGFGLNADWQINNKFQAGGWIGYAKAEQYVFFFNKFKEVRNSEILGSQLAINEWTEDNYERVADRYNKIKPEDWEYIDGAQARTMLEEIGQAIRDYEKSFIASRTVNIDEAAKNYLSHWIEEKLNHP